jgi:hypothetical protein
MAVPVPYGKQRQGHHLEVEMAFIEVRDLDQQTAMSLSTTC